ncbi:hypothetical protein AHAS_Ahas11G0084900 [Arachis hypogaea]
MWPNSTRKPVTYSTLSILFINDKVTNDSLCQLGKELVFQEADRNLLLVDSWIFK